MPRRFQLEEPEPEDEEPEPSPQNPTRGTWQVMRELLDPTYVPEAQAWVGIPERVVEQVAKMRPFLQLASEFGVQALPRAERGLPMAEYLGGGLEANAYRMGDLVLKRATMMNPHSPYHIGRHVNPEVPGMAPILERYANQYGKEMGYVQPLIPGEHPEAITRPSKEWADIMELAGKFAEKHPTKRIVDIHPGNVIRSPWTDIDRPRNWIIDLGTKEAHRGAPHFPPASQHILDFEETIEMLRQSKGEFPWLWNYMKRRRGL